MSNIISYKGYEAIPEYNSEDRLFYGKVMGIRSTIIFESESAEKLESAFRKMVDLYISDCKKRGTEPEKPFKGSFNVRIDSELHRDLFKLAIENKKTLNAYIKGVLASHVKNLFDSETASYSSLEVNELRVMEPTLAGGAKNLEILSKEIAKTIISSTQKKKRR